MVLSKIRNIGEPIALRGGQPGHERGPRYDTRKRECVGGAIAPGKVDAVGHRSRQTLISRAWFVMRRERVRRPVNSHAAPRNNDPAALPRW